MNNLTEQELGWAVKEVAERTGMPFVSSKRQLANNTLMWYDPARDEYYAIYPKTGYARRAIRSRFGHHRIGGVAIYYNWYQLNRRIWGETGQRVYPTRELYPMPNIGQVGEGKTATLHLTKLIDLVVAGFEIRRSRNTPIYPGWYINE